MYLLNSLVILFIINTRNERILSVNANVPSMLRTFSAFSHVVVFYLSLVFLFTAHSLSMENRTCRHRDKPHWPLSTFVMQRSIDQDDLHEYLDRLRHCRTRTEAIDIRSEALKFIDRYRRERLEDLDEQIRLMGQFVLKVFDQSQGKIR